MPSPRLVLLLSLVASACGPVSPTPEPSDTTLFVGSVAPGSPTLAVGSSIDIVAIDACTEPSTMRLDWTCAPERVVEILDAGFDAPGIFELVNTTLPAGEALGALFRVHAVGPGRATLQVRARLSDGSIRSEETTVVAAAIASTEFRLMCDDPGTRVPAARGPTATSPWLVQADRRFELPTTFHDAAGERIFAVGFFPVDVTPPSFGAYVPASQDEMTPFLAGSAKGSGRVQAALGAAAGVELESFDAADVTAIVPVTSHDDFVDAHRDDVRSMPLVSIGVLVGERAACLSTSRFTLEARTPDTCRPRVDGDLGTDGVFHVAEPWFRLETRDPGACEVAVTLERDGAPLHAVFTRRVE